MIVKRPHVTEKTILLAENLNQYTFEVTLNADKSSAAKEIEDMFGVKVINVTTNTRLGRPKKFGKYRAPGRRSDKKYMVFKLKEGDKIDIFTSK